MAGDVVYARIPAYLSAAVDYLVETGVHRSRSELIRVALETYLGQFQSQGEGDAPLAFTKLAELASRRQRYETVSAWFSEIRHLLNTAVANEDDELIDTIFQSASEAYEKLPQAYRKPISDYLSSDAIWIAAAKQRGIKPFWT